MSPRKVVIRYLTSLNKINGELFINKNLIIISCCLSLF